MSDRLITAAQANFPDEPGREPRVPHVALIREAVGTLGWGTMNYRCEACGFEWEIWLGLGVEGPTSLRAASLYVPAPFTLSSCPAWVVKPDATPEERAQYRHLMPCSGSMSHVRFSDDREFPVALIPDDAPRFVLDAWHADCAQLVIPTPAMVAARRHHSDQVAGVVSEGDPNA